MRKKLSHYERGEIIPFFAFIMLPLFFLLSSLSVDMGNYLAQQKSLQSLVDWAALAGVKYLPSKSGAEQAARNYLTDFAPELVSSKEITVSMSDDLINVQIDKVFEPFFAKYFNHLVGQDLTLRQVVYAQARIAPLDVYIAMDRGASLAPPLNSSPSNAWGQSVGGQWDSFSFFDSSPEPHGYNALLATQRCFNPKFSPIKQSAVMLYDYLTSFTKNRMAIAVFPSASGAGYGVLKNITDPANSNTNFYEIRKESDNGTLVNVEIPESAAAFPVSSLECAGALERENQTTNYQIPSKTGYSYPSADLVTISAPNSWSLNSSFPLSLRETLWSRSVAATGEMYFSQVTQDLAQKLFNTPNVAGLVGVSPIKVAFILTKTVPRLDDGSLFETANDWKAQNLKKTFAQNIMQISSNPNAVKQTLVINYMIADSEVSSDTVSQLQTFFNQIISENESQPVHNLTLRVNVSKSENPQSLVSQALPNLLLENKRGMLSL